MERLKICGRFEVPLFEDCGFSHMISIGDPGESFDGLRLSGIAEDSHLILEFSDTHEACRPGAPTPENVAALFSWLDRSSKMNSLLVHCAAGMGRSPAVALLALCALDPARPVQWHVERINAAAESPFLMPNILVSRIGGDLLGRGTEISAAVKIWRAEQGNSD